MIFLSWMSKYSRIIKLLSTCKDIIRIVNYTLLLQMSFTCLTNTNLQLSESLRADQRKLKKNQYFKLHNNCLEHPRTKADNRIPHYATCIIFAIMSVIERVQGALMGCLTKDETRKMYAQLVCISTIIFKVF